MYLVRTVLLVTFILCSFLLAVPGHSRADEVCGEIEDEDFGAFEGIRCATGQGKGTVTVFDQAELDAYLLDFGFDGRRVKNLRVGFNPTGVIDIYSPCRVSVAGENDLLDIDATSMRVFGRLGVTVAENHGNVDEGIVVEEGITLVSTEGGAGFSKDLVLEADQICVQAAGTAKVGEANDVDAIEVDVVSTGDSSKSHAQIRRGAYVTADRVRLLASREASIGMLATLEVGDLTVTSTGIGALSLAAIEQGAEVKADSLSLTSGNKAKLGPHSSVDVQGTFEMDAASPNKCTIVNAASYVAGDTAGNCLP